MMDISTITATVMRPADQYGTDWNWAEEATAAWLAAARDAGITVDQEDDDVYGEYTAARVLIDGAWYEIELRGDEVRAIEVTSW
jgi:hypothetical protein